MNVPSLPLPDKAIKVAYHELIADIDSLLATLIVERFRDTLQCRPGCAECCMQFSVLSLEAAFVRERIKQFQPIKRLKDKSCPLLADNRCSIYDIRPIICRTQGLPIAYIDEGSSCIEVSACRLNFPDDHQFEKEDLLFMDQFNSRLVELNIQYCLSVGLDPQQRIALTDL